MAPWNSNPSASLASLDLLGIIGGKWKKRVRIVFINADNMQETVHFEVGTNGFALSDLFLWADSIIHSRKVCHLHAETRLVAQMGENAS